MGRVSVALMPTKFGVPSYIRSRDIEEFTKYADSAHLTPLGKYAIAGKPTLGF